MRKINSILGSIAIILLVADICAGIYFTKGVEESGRNWFNAIVESVGGE